MTFSPAGLQSDMPQLKTFVSNGQLIGLPFDSSFLVTTVNQKDFAKAGITTMPTTLAGFTAASHGGWAVVCGCGLAVLLVGLASTSGWASPSGPSATSTFLAP